MEYAILTLCVMNLLLLLFKKDKIITVKEPYVIYDFQNKQEVIKIEQEGVEIKTETKEKIKRRDFSHISDDQERDYVTEECNARGITERAARKEWLENGETF